MSAVWYPVKWFYTEFGLAAIHETGRNAYLIILARACRMFAHGAITLILGMSLFGFGAVGYIIDNMELHLGCQSRRVNANAKLQHYSFPPWNSLTTKSDYS